jgi:hypothetical protein
MIENLTTYSKCFYANKVALSGFALTAYGVVDTALNFSNESTSTLIPGVLLLLATSFGKDTYYSYKKMQKHIKHRNKINYKFRDNLSGYYCDRAGYRLALKEKGLEDLL